MVTHAEINYQLHKNAISYSGEKLVHEIEIEDKELCDEKKHNISIFVFGGFSSFLTHC